MRFDPTKVFALAAVMSGAAWAVGFISLNGGWGAPRWDLIGHAPVRRAGSQRSTRAESATRIDSIFNTATLKEWATGG